jgi:uncharacterized membrane protein YjfL (UPF0719 family)
MNAVWPWIAVALTLIVLSRALGDNPLFRFSQYLFVGLALGYTATVVINKVLVESIDGAMQQGDPVSFVFLAAPVVLGLLLWTRLGNQNMSWLANIPLALLFGVAAALALGGTILGTLLPQLDDSLFSVNELSGAPLEVMIGRIVVLVGVILVLMSFRFTRQSGKQPQAVERGIARLGRWWLLISLGVVFAGALLTYQSALIDRIQFVTRQFGLG